MLSRYGMLESQCLRQKNFFLFQYRRIFSFYAGQFFVFPHHTSFAAALQRIFRQIIMKRSKTRIILCFYGILFTEKPHRASEQCSLDSVSCFAKKIYLLPCPSFSPKNKSFRVTFRKEEAGGKVKRCRTDAAKAAAPPLFRLGFDMVSPRRKGRAKIRIGFVRRTRIKASKIYSVSAARTSASCTCESFSLL